MSVSINDALQRWNTRVIPNKWHIDPNGAEKYLAKYGKNIGIAKLQSLANIAREKNAMEFCKYMEAYIKLIQM